MLSWETSFSPPIVLPSDDDEEDFDSAYDDFEEDEEFDDEEDFDEDEDDDYDEYDDYADEFEEEVPRPARRRGGEWD